MHWFELQVKRHHHQRERTVQLDSLVEAGAGQGLQALGALRGKAGRESKTTWFSEKSDHSRKCKKVKMKSLGRKNAQTFLVVKRNVTYAIVCVTSQDGVVGENFVILQAKCNNYENEIPHHDWCGGGDDCLPA